MFILQEFDGYMIHDTKKEDAHFIIDVSKDFYDLLTSEETVELNSVTEHLKDLNYRQGI